MSIVRSTERAVLISHEDFLENVYFPSYTINSNIFDITSPYLRQNQTSFEDNTDGRKRKRKHRAKEDDPTSKHVEELYNNFIKFVEPLGLFTNAEIMRSKNNKATTDFIQNFYSNLGDEELPTLNGRNMTDGFIETRVSNETYLIPPHCQFYCNNVTNILNLVEHNKYDLVVLDPPWWNKYIRRVNKTTSNNRKFSYQMMENDDILHIPIEKLIRPNALVVIWCTNSQAHLSATETKFLAKWNLKLLKLWYWLKVTKLGRPVCQFRGSLCKQPYENILIACHKDADVSAFNGLIELDLVVSVPSAIHSHKPPLIEILNPYLPAKPNCLEIFARSLLPNFTSLGLEVLKLQNIKLYDKNKQIT